MISRAAVLFVTVFLTVAGVASAQVGPEPPASTIEAQAQAAAAAKHWNEAYRLCLRAASDYISEHNQAKADETSKECEHIRSEWVGGSSSSTTATAGTKRPLWSEFTPRSGVPNGAYNCTTMMQRFIGMSAPGGVGGMPLRVPEMMFLGSLDITPGHYSGRTTTPGTWSGSGGNLHFSGKPFNAAKAEYGVNGSGHSTVRFTWQPTTEGAGPQVWMCTR